ncbi:hypothetical protein MRX96_016600 [Rhipicephalus microplus]
MQQHTPQVPGPTVPAQTVTTAITFKPSPQAAPKPNTPTPPAAAASLPVAPVAFGEPLTPLPLDPTMSLEELLSILATDTGGCLCCAVWYVCRGGRTSRPCCPVLLSVRRTGLDGRRAGSKGLGRRFRPPRPRSQGPVFAAGTLSDSVVPALSGPPPSYSKR